jgi:hypothetical protein
VTQDVGHVPGDPERRAVAVDVRPGGWVEPKNNADERAVRHAVCWRKTSYGTNTEAGSRFVVANCRQ